MAQSDSNISILADLTRSLSGADRFSFSPKYGFRLAVPRGGYDNIHSRASISDLKAHLLPVGKLTRGGHLSSNQLEPPQEQEYSWWLAQIIHYGLDFRFGREHAKALLYRELVSARLTVPSELAQLERSMRMSYNRREKDRKRKSTSNGNPPSVQTSTAVTTDAEDSGDEADNISEDSSDHSSDASTNTSDSSTEDESHNETNIDPRLRTTAPPAAAAPKVLEKSASSTPEPSSDALSTGSEADLPNLPPPPNFTLPNPVVKAPRHRIKVEETHGVRLDDPFLDPTSSQRTTGPPREFDEMFKSSQTPTVHMDEIKLHERHDAGNDRPGDKPHPGQSEGKKTKRQHTSEHVRKSRDKKRRHEDLGEFIDRTIFCKKAQKHVNPSPSASSLNALLDHAQQLLASPEKETRPTVLTPEDSAQRSAEKKHRPSSSANSTHRRGLTAFTLHNSAPLHARTFQPIRHGALAEARPSKNRDSQLPGERGGGSHVHTFEWAGAAETRPSEHHVAATFKENRMGPSQVYTFGSGGAGKHRSGKYRSAMAAAAAAE